LLPIAQRFCEELNMTSRPVSYLVEMKETLIDDLEHKNVCDWLFAHERKLLTRVLLHECEVYP
jgi:hypothetical protein